MTVRGLLFASKSPCKSNHLKNVLYHPFNFEPLFSKSVLNQSRFCEVMCNAFGRVPAASPLYEFERFHFEGRQSIHTSRWSNKLNEPVKPVKPTESIIHTEGSDNGKIKRKKLKGKKAVVRQSIHTSRRSNKHNEPVKPVEPTESSIHTEGSDNGKIKRKKFKGKKAVVRQSIHTSRQSNKHNEPVKPVEPTESSIHTEGSDNGKIKRKKLKGKRAVVKWLKHFRFKKKKEYERMTAEEKILYKLRKARKKEERYVEALKKIEPKESAETKHDPEILTPEEHFYFLKMGQKSKNYVPIGRRGIYQGVILNMHLHWKKHETLQVVVKTFTREEVKEIAVELARLTGGIVLEVKEDKDNTIIMYRGKNYSQPPTEIMSPRITLPRKKALDKSKYRDGLRAVRKYIPRLGQDLELLRARAENQAESKLGVTEESQTNSMTEATGETQLIDIAACNSRGLSLKLQKLLAQNDECHEDDDSVMHSGMDSDSEALSDIFETESDTETENAEQHLYLDEFDKFPIRNDGDADDFKEHLRQISADSKMEKSRNKDAEVPDLDEVDRMVLRAASLLKKKRR